MSVTEQERVDRALEYARAAAFRPGEYVGQQSFVTASEVLALAREAGVGPGVRVLDLCCGVAGPGLHLTRELRCDYLGVDASPGAVARARQRAATAEVEAHFLVATVPPLPPGPVDVVLLLETMLAFPDKRGLLEQVAAALPVGGRFAFTVEEGAPLTPEERMTMPGADTVWLVPLDELRDELDRAGLAVTWSCELTGSHRATVDALVGAYGAVAPDVTAGVEADLGVDCVSDLLTTHRHWSRWLRDGRVRKFAVVAQKLGPRWAAG